MFMRMWMKKASRFYPPGQDLDSTPYDVTWNLELDREIRSRVTLRLSYLSSRTYNLFVVGPQQLPGTNPLLLMTNTGGSRYQEFESTVRYRTGKYADINFSYVHSSARGDLNVLSQVYVPFEQPVIRPNFFSTLNSDVPDRVGNLGTIPASVENYRQPRAGPSYRVSVFGGRRAAKLRGPAQQPASSHVHVD